MRKVPADCSRKHLSSDHPLTETLSVSISHLELHPLPAVSVPLPNLFAVFSRALLIWCFVRLKSPEINSDSNKPMYIALSKTPFNENASAFKVLETFLLIWPDSSPTHCIVYALSIRWLDPEYLTYHHVKYRNLHLNKLLAFLALLFLGRKFQIPSSWSSSLLCFLSLVYLWILYSILHSSPKNQTNIWSCLGTNPINPANNSPQKRSFILIKLSVFDLPFTSTSLPQFPQHINLDLQKYLFLLSLSSNPHTKSHLIFSYLSWVSLSSLSQHALCVVWNQSERNHQQQHCITSPGNTIWKQLY